VAGYDGGDEKELTLNQPLSELDVMEWLPPSPDGIESAHDVVDIGHRAERTATTPSA
jgi:hypothetical protein